MKLLPLKRRKIDDDTRKAVLNAINNDCPFVMIAQRPDGSWEISCHYLVDKAYEAIGALEHAKIRLLNDDIE